MSLLDSILRRKFRVTGVVQGVGFRPFIYRIATQHNLTGWVCNTSGSVEADVEGTLAAIEDFTHAIQTGAPVLARVDSVTSIEADPVGYSSFEIHESQSDASSESAIPADVCTCQDCFHEIADSSDRRFDYPFTNCTNCGPRFTIIQRIPYDRVNTTMGVFEMCPACALEYRNPLNRRFHAEPTACPVCGPHIWFEEDGKIVDSQVLELAGKKLADGSILAIKGLGGFHLACDARNDEAVKTLRNRKGRAAKPFALMVKDIDEAARLCVMDDTARKLLQSPRRPIILMQKRDDAPIPESIAPGNNNLGLMLPYTPLHALLFKYSPPALVMTSANLSEEPLVFTNSSARQKLSNLADAYVFHDRDIHVPCDDSVVRPIADNKSIIVRRARGFVPDSIELPIGCESILATGGEQKNTFCMAWGSQAVLSQHIGDLDTIETFDYYRYAVDHFLSLFKQEPKVIAHDLHPAYMSTQYAHERAGARLIGVQHHHAHIAACLAENSRTEKCIGLSLDGTGYGTDGTIWGGEVLIADLAEFERVGHFRQVRMPGGEAAIRDPKRMALSYLHAVYGQDFADVAKSLGLIYTPLEMRIIKHQIETGLNSPITSSAGRLFDATAAAVDICRERSYEGQPAIKMEMNAANNVYEAYPLSTISDEDMLVLDTFPIFKSAVMDKLAGVPGSTISARFHNSLVNLLTEACEKLRERTGINLIALSGGVLQNALISTNLENRLNTAGFEVLTHKLLPPNDACISYGQASAAAAILAREQR